MSTLEEWIADLDKAVSSVAKETEKVVFKGSMNIKKDWANRWRGINHIPNLPYTITFDMDGLDSEIGPDKAMVVGGGPHKTPGNLGAGIEFGFGNNAPRPGGLPALATEEPKFVDALGDVGENLLAER